MAVTRYEPRSLLNQLQGYKRVERSFGSFYRRFSLPDSANGETINAKSKHGVLEIVIPKREAVQPKRINVSSKE